MTTIRDPACMTMHDRPVRERPHLPLAALLVGARCGGVSNDPGALDASADTPPGAPSAQFRAVRSASTVRT
jgi:hypothetical protein